MKFLNAKNYSVSLVIKVAIVMAVFVSIACLQHLYDAHESTASNISDFLISPNIVKMVDIGLHSAVASYVWVGTMSDIVTLSDKDNGFIEELKFVNAMDSRLSFPYSFTVMILPLIRNYPNRIQESLDIGIQGVQNADLDWKIPFYMAATYYIELNDKKNALYYFDRAARTPGVPDNIRTFGLNFGSETSVRNETKSIWLSLYNGATDNDTKERALLHLERISNLEFLVNASAIYKRQFGEFPKTVEDLVTKKIISEVPPDPFGFGYVITQTGTVEL